MNLTEKLEKSVKVLHKNATIEKKASLAKFVKNLEKALDDFLKNCEPEFFRNTPEYVDLAALIDLAENKEIVTKEWLAEKAASIGKTYAKFAKKEKEELVIELIRAKKAEAVIKELKTTPKQRMQNRLSKLANLSVEKAEAKLGEMKPKELEEFCRHNEITMELTKKGKFDKKTTLPNALKKIQTVRDYLKL